jgi:hypothetical protein
MHLYRRISLVLVLTFGIASMQCQTAAPTPADTAPSFQSKVNVVLIDVVVTNGNDEPVAGLDKTDFQVLEDNKVQPISVFEEHKGGLQPSRASCRRWRPVFTPTFRRSRQVMR